MKTGDSEDHHQSGTAKGKIALETVGCKLNQAESQSLAHSFIRAGYRLVAPEENPDVLILNTCTVTHIADRKCRQYLRHFHRQNPDSLIVAAGCYADRDPDGLLRVEGVDLAIGNRDKERLLKVVEERQALRGISRGGNGHRPAAMLLTSLRTRSMIKVQDGCSYLCSYCIVPRVRGAERSMPAVEILRAINGVVDEGCQEVVLTGTRIGAYNGPGGLEGLLRQILDETSVPRIRLSSLQPGEISPTLLRLWSENERVCRHLHLALQSGCDSVLHRMKRKYTTVEYRRAVEAARAAMPDVAITTDVIAGFPGETAEEFEESYRFCEDTGFAALHIFSYSARPGTLASQLAGRVPEKVKKERSRMMLDLARRSASAFRCRFQGSTMPVLWEEQGADGLWTGHTGNYLKVATRSGEPLANRVLETRLIGEHEDALWGKVETITVSSSRESREIESIWRRSRGMRSPNSYVRENDLL